MSILIFVINARLYTYFSASKYSVRGYCWQWKWEGKGMGLILRNGEGMGTTKVIPQTSDVD